MMLETKLLHASRRTQRSIDWSEDFFLEYPVWVISVAVLVAVVKRRLFLLGRFPFTKNSGLKFRKLHVLNGTVHSGCTDPTQATARFVIVASQHTHNYALKEKSKYCLYPKEHSTVEKGRWKTKGGGILFRVESLWMQVKVKNSCELKRYVSQNIRTIRSNSWNCTVNKFGVLAKFVFSHALLYSFQLNW